jgi:hypothetical protein
MPNARIDMHRSLESKIPQMSAAILKGMGTPEGFDMPAEDLFQVFRLHDAGSIVYSPTHPNAERTDMIFVEILATPRYSGEQMERGLEAISDELTKAGIKRDNVLLLVTPVNKWYAPAV